MADTRTQRAAIKTPVQRGIHRKTLDYLLAHKDQPCTIEEIAYVTGYDVRQINNSFTTVRRNFPDNVVRLVRGVYAWRTDPAATISLHDPLHDPLDVSEPTRSARLRHAPGTRVVFTVVQARDIAEQQELLLSDDNGCLWKTAPLSW